MFRYIHITSSEPDKHVEKYSRAAVSLRNNFRQAYTRRNKINSDKRRNNSEIILFHYVTTAVVLLLDVPSLAKRRNVCSNAAQTLEGHIGLVLSSVCPSAPGQTKV